MLNRFFDTVPLIVRASLFVLPPLPVYWDSGHALQCLAHWLAILKDQIYDRYLIICSVILANVKVKLLNSCFLISTRNTMNDPWYTRLAYQVQHLFFIFFPVLFSFFSWLSYVVLSVTKLIRSNQHQMLFKRMLFTTVFHLRSYVYINKYDYKMMSNRKSCFLL